MLAGGLGALARYGLGRLTVNMAWLALPFATLAANLIGCFLIGYLSWAMVHRWSLSNELQIVVLTGFLGGFTTFSAFSLETIHLFQQDASVKAIVYVLLHVLLGLGLCLLGMLLARHS